MVVFAAVSVVVFATGGSVFGAVFVGVGLAVFAWGLTKRGGRQVTGTKCAVCQVVVTLEHEAEICAQCGAGLHARCLEAHQGTLHADSSKKPAAGTPSP